MFNSTHVRNLAALAGFTVLAATAMPQLKADEVDKKVTVTFSAPVEIPGNRVLPAGTYVLKTLRDNPGIVRIMNGEENQQIGMFQAVPEFRPIVPENVDVRFEERHADAPEALKSWTYPGDSYGFELLYPADHK